MAFRNQRILITGGTGMLGLEVRKFFRSKLNYDVFSVSRKPPYQNENNIGVDITKEKELLSVLKKVQPEIIIHCAAEVNVNRCEIERDYVYNLHVNATRNIVEYTSVDKFIYISTDSVFDGQRGNYSETDSVNPLNYYAYTKLKGEEVTINANKNVAVIRTNIIGYHTPLQSSLFEWGYEKLRSNTPINGYENVYFNPLYCTILAQKISELLERQFEPGIYNVAAMDPISKFEFLRSIARQFSFDENLISPVALENKSNNAAFRPLNTTLNTGKVQNLGIALPFMVDNINLLYRNFNKSFA